MNMHIGICGPINISSIKQNIKTSTDNWPQGMGGTPVNHEINALLERGYKVSVFSLTPEIEKDKHFEWHQDNLSVYIGPYRKKAFSRCSDFFRVEREFLKDKISKGNPDIIHAHWQYEWAWAALDSKIKVLVTCHDSPVKILKNYPDIYRLCRLMMAFKVLKKASWITTVSPDTMKGLKLLTNKPIKVIPNFEDSYVFSFYKERSQCSTNCKIVMINNSFYGNKNVIEGIKAFAEFKKLLPDIELHLYGYCHGIGEDAYKWCENNNMSKGVFFHGSLSFNSLMAELSNADILLHTSKEESFGMVLVEAMAMGIPVIAGNRSGGIPWLLKDGGGILVDINTTEAILNGLKFVSNENNYYELSKKAHEVALLRFSNDVVMESYIQSLNYIYNL